MQFDVLRIREDFPILQTSANGKPLVYLDNGATTQKPRAVIEAISTYYEAQNANIHRGVYYLSQLATDLYENARRTIQKFINAAESREVLFTRGTTEAINLVAQTFGRSRLSAGDEVFVSAMEHHSNIVPWQMACEATGATLRVIPMNDDGELLLDDLQSMLSPKAKLVAVNHVSNSLGTVNDVNRITKMAHAVGAKVLIDGAQWVAHKPTDVRAIDCDFYAFSGHKLFGPTGIGILYGKRELLESLPPWQGGGDMIETVTFAKTTYAQLPNKFEAGTPDIAGAIGLGAAIEYVQSIGLEKISAYENELVTYAADQIRAVPGVRIIGNAKHRAGVVSFVIEDPPIAAHDLGVALDLQGIAVRTGHHCCQPVMDRFGVPATARASIAMYNTKAEIDVLVAALTKIVAAEVKARPVAKTQAPAGAEVRYPAASANDVAAAADLVAEDFGLFEEREDKTQYVLDLADKLPRYFELLKKVTTRVPGCMSEVYLVARKVEGSPDKVEFIADANAEIVRGLISILERIFSGQKAVEIIAFDHEAFFRRIGLDQFITSQRRNGLEGMIRRIKSSAAELTGTKS